MSLVTDNDSWFLFTLYHLNSSDTETTDYSIQANEPNDEVILHEAINAALLDFRISPVKSKENETVPAVKENETAIAESKQNETVPAESDGNDDAFVNSLFRRRIIHRKPVRLHAYLPYPRQVNRHRIKSSEVTCRRVGITLSSERLDTESQTGFIIKDWKVLKFHHTNNNSCITGNAFNIADTLNNIEVGKMDFATVSHLTLNVSGFQYCFPTIKSRASEFYDEIKGRTRLMGMPLDGVHTFKSCYHLLARLNHGNYLLAYNGSSEGKVPIMNVFFIPRNAELYESYSIGTDGLIIGITFCTLSAANLL